MTTIDWVLFLLNVTYVVSFLINRSYNEISECKFMLTGQTCNQIAMTTSALGNLTPLLARVVCEKLLDLASYTNLLQTFSQMSMQRHVRSLISLMEMRAQRHIRVKIQTLVTRSAWRNDLKKCANSKNNKCFTVLLLMKRFITVYSPFLYHGSWASCKIRKIAGCTCAGNAGNVFPANTG